MLAAMMLRSPLAIISVVLLAVLPGVAAADPPTQAPRALPPIVQETVWNLDVDVVAVGPGTSGSIAKFELSASAHEAGVYETPVGSGGAWPNGTLRVTAAIDRLTSDEAHFDFSSQLTLPNRAPIHASRSFALSEGRSELIEIFSEGDHRLLVSLRGEEGTRPVVHRIAAASPRVLLHVEIERIDGEKSVPLETNDLNTFIGEPVEYSFDLGGDSERLRLVLTPLSMDGAIVQIRAQVSGQLPDKKGPVVLSRDQLFAASRDATSSVEVVAGGPPRGYRFRITPSF